MDSASVQFALFGIAAAIVSSLNRSLQWRSLVLTVASVIFISLLVHDFVSLLPMAAFIVLGYAAIIALKRRLLESMAWAVVPIVFAYIWLKRYTFVPEYALIQHPYFTLGLSYMFFRVLHLVVEARESDDRTRVGFFAYLLYLVNFTTFVSGPIQRFDEFTREQFSTPSSPLGAGMVGLQLERLIRGFFKVNVLAMLLDLLRTDALLQLSGHFSVPTKVMLVVQLIVLYPLFLYANFSGYIDIVIALARLMHVRLPENFDRPFAASSVLEFWTRWHITLSNWFRTYVYNALLVALMRRVSAASLQPLLGVFCFFVTFFLVGLWHGRTSEFTVFGLLTGGGVSLNKLWQLAIARAVGRKRYKDLKGNLAYRSLGRGLTFSWFGFTLIWFWADWKQIDGIFRSISSSGWISVVLLTWLGMSVLLQTWEAMRIALLSVRFGDEQLFTSRYARVVYATSLGLISIAITVMLNQPAPGIVYKAF